MQPPLLHLSSLYLLPLLSNVHILILGDFLLVYSHLSTAHYYTAFIKQATTQSTCRRKQTSPTTQPRLQQRGPFHAIAISQRAHITVASLTCRSSGPIDHADNTTQARTTTSPGAHVGHASQPSSQQPSMPLNHANLAAHDQQASPVRRGQAPSRRRQC